VERGDALRFLAGSGAPFAIVFLDPPFASGLLLPAAQRLAAGGWLSQGALVYVECAAREGIPALPAGYLALRNKQAGEVGYHLYAHHTARPSETA
jgi:16S rRNA (guanine966-N2)-methyltransferase